MSDPMTNVKIEDVLTSIRRLVSEVGDVAARSVPEPRAARPLVLTPALRIDRGRARPGAAPLTLRPSDRVPGKAPTGAAQDLLATIAELEAAVLDQPEEWEDDGTGTDLDKTWASVGFRSDAEVEDAVEIPPVAPSRAADWPRTLAEAQRTFGGRTPSPDPQPVFRHRDAAGRPTPAATDEDDHTDELIEDEALAPDEEAALAFYLEGGGGVTRVALEDIVRQIVREELQGRMGERITQNVRKMVRREIARAMTNGALD